MAIDHKRAQELNRQIATALGYSQEVMQEGFYQSACDEDPYFVHNRWLLIYDGDEAAWEHFPKQWAENTDAMLGLFAKSGPEGGLEVDLHRTPQMGWTARIVGREPFYGDALPEAMAEAWLAWKRGD